MTAHGDAFKCILPSRSMAAFLHFMTSSFAASLAISSFQRSLVLPLFLSFSTMAMSSIFFCSILVIGPAHHILPNFI
ncbi:unnamed protein product [Nezara viridula]|uniref:Uncharacterized protein n=1 Tax=Nezara viridula TaxID=85310 RepID=A0A9P0H0H6_NEZVI|nr:unnamed protein product [Nezara viridula]